MAKPDRMDIHTLSSGGGDRRSPPGSCPLLGGSTGCPPAPPPGRPRPKKRTAVPPASRPKRSNVARAPTAPAVDPWSPAACRFHHQRRPSNAPARAKATGNEASHPAAGTKAMTRWISLRNRLTPPRDGESLLASNQDHLQVALIARLRVLRIDQLGRSPVLVPRIENAGIVPQVAMDSKCLAVRFCQKPALSYNRIRHRKFDTVGSSIKSHGGGP